MLTDEGPVGRLVYWTESMGVKNRHEWVVQTRCGIVHATDEGGGVSVTLTKLVDPNCPEHEENIRLSIAAKIWRYQP